MNADQKLDREGDAVRLSRSFDAPVRDVFAAWTDAGKYRLWAWGSLGSETKATVDCRVGGEYRVSTARPDGAVWSFSGRYLQVVPDELLVYTVSWDAPMGYEPADETVEVTFRQRPGGTDVEFVHRGVPLEVARREHLKGWASTLEALSALLEGGPRAEGP